MDLGGSRAWADLGLLSLLAGRDREAMQAYHNSVLEVRPERAAAFDAAIRQVQAPA